MKRRNFLQIMAALAAAPLVSTKAKQTLMAKQLATGPALPVGYIQPYVGKVGKAVPSGWLPCDGREIASSEFPDLVALLQGDTLKPTKVPDMRANKLGLPGNLQSSNLEFDNPSNLVVKNAAGEVQKAVQVQYIIKAAA
jgi:hypothetical protein